MVAPVWVDEMDKYSGLETHILGFTPGGHVRLIADEGFFSWSPMWISKVV